MFTSDKEDGYKAFYLKESKLTNETLKDEIDRLIDEKYIFYKSGSGSEALLDTGKAVS